MQKLCVLALLTSPALLASSSGLNNIPTADTAGNRLLVFQGYSTFGVGQRPSDVVAFKYGIDPWATNTWRNRFEVGLDSYYAPGDAGPGVAQFKYTTQPNPNSPAFCIGVANVAMTSASRLRAGQPYSYGVVTEDLKAFRVHGGYALQAGNNNSALLGIDKTVKVSRHDFMIRADAIQINHQKDWAASIGGITGIGKRFAFESWVTMPTDSRKPGITLKLNFILPL